jgi:hypothetical protein
MFALSVECPGAHAQVPETVYYADGRQKLHRSCGYSRRVRRTDYRTHRQACADKWTRFRQDQVCLEHLPDCSSFGPGVGINAAVEIGECQSIGRVGERGHITIQF